MASNYVGIYLNDHLAGSGLGIEISSLLAKRVNGTPTEKVLSGLRAEFESERVELKNLIKRLGVAESNLRKAGGWVNAKLLEIKLSLEDREGSFFLFEGLEALSVGIAGKHLMWLVLFELSKKSDRFTSPDYPSLIAQALRQREQVEILRLEAGAKSFIG